MRHDLLTGERCWRCAHPATRGDTPAQRIGSFEQVTFDPGNGVDCDDDLHRDVSGVLRLVADRVFGDPGR
jgi:hypothetical protein